MPASTLDGGPNFAGSRLDVAIANIAQFGNAPLFSVGATFSIDPVAFNVSPTLNAGANFTPVNPTTDLNGAIDNVVTTIVVDSASGFPLTAFTVVVDFERMRVTGGFGTTTWTVTRAYDGTQAATHSDEATVTVFQTLNIGTGDDVYYLLSGRGLAQGVDVRQGSAASPSTQGLGPTFKVSRWDSIPEANMPLGIGANNQGNAAIWGASQGDANMQGQVSAGYFSAVTSSTQSTHNDDACGLSAHGFITGSGTGDGIGAYLEGRRDTATGSTNAVEARSANQTATDDPFVTNSASKTMGYWATAGGLAPSAVAYNIGTFGGAQTWHVGYAAVAGSVTDQTFRDETNSTTSILINGTHTNAIAMASTAGISTFGGTSAIFGVANGLMEIQGSANNIDGLLAMGSTSAANGYSIRVRNLSGQVKLGVANAGAITGAAAGDGLLQAVSSNKVMHIAGTAACLDVSNANVMTSQVDHIFAAHIVSTASGTPASSALGVNVTSVTFTGNDVRGTIAVVMSGALAANTRISTNTFAVSYGATSPKVTLVDQTSAVGLTIVNFYVSAQSTGVSFDLSCDQALAAGTYTIDYIVLG